MCDGGAGRPAVLRAADAWANPIETRRRLVDAEARRLEALGGTLVGSSAKTGSTYGVAMRDPEGNEFDMA